MQGNTLISIELIESFCRVKVLPITDRCKARAPRIATDTTNKRLSINSEIYQNYTHP